jgi:hypothetical protein
MGQGHRTLHFSFTLLQPLISARRFEKARAWRHNAPNLYIREILEHARSTHQWLLGIFFYDDSEDSRQFNLSKEDSVRWLFEALRCGKSNSTCPSSAKLQQLARV